MCRPGTGEGWRRRLSLGEGGGCVGKVRLQAELGWGDSFRPGEVGKGVVF